MKRIWKTLGILAVVYLCLVLIHLRSQHLQKLTTTDFAEIYATELMGDSTNAERNELVKILVKYDLAQRSIEMIQKEISRTREGIAAVERDLTTLGCRFAAKTTVRAALPPLLPKWRDVLRNSGAESMRARIEFVKLQRVFAVSQMGELVELYEREVMEFQKRREQLASAIQSQRCK